MTVYWGILEKSATDNKTVDQAIADALANYEYFKTISVWGLLPKSAIDDTTIEERINELIASHEADATAHLGTGESLESHKSTDIIDHPAGSVLADKRTMTELSVNHDFSTLAVWGNAGDINIDNWPDCTLYVEYGVTNSSYLYLNPQSPTPFLDYDYDTLFQIIFRTDLSGTKYHAWFGMGLSDDTPTEGFGFVIQAGILKAYIGYGATQTFSTISGADIANAHIYRVQLLPSAGEARYYIDGTLVETLSIPASSPDSDGGPMIGARVSATGDGNTIVSDLHFSRAIINI